ncbi:uncharacterized protein LAESUDRAFT_724533 [Laetiporus sulphureus 93-53]|uniref:DUF4112 domain-containing protein n=1 Tax=Laetiporus sulphureus 93-53 TaxID=1314785 RepID=A0A165ER01_9APHY|nr:uncharacterized protein LAESUDRAFT_724533 [Laetiporus sulphureus 93-53]KZT07584.1 hypothetical protein LAESUDRAFT_724533 [Laetiporus sulphureus 93-53]
MTSDFATSIGRKLFEKHLQNYTPEDPLYETYTDKRGRQRRRKRELPPGLSSRDAKILKSVKRRAHHLDKGFSICGMRFGWTFFIGIVPGAGDIANAALNYVLVVRKARRADIPDWLLSRMLVNNAVSAAVGFVPIVGDIMLAVYKANSRNAALLEEFLRIRGEEALKMAEEAQAQAQAAVSTGGPPAREERPNNKREGSGWFVRRNKAKDTTPETAPSPLVSMNRDSRFIENVP